jgi:UDP-glucose 4,6-dehydratase
MDVAEEICNVFGLNKEETIQFVEDRPFNDCRYFIEDAKLAALGWSEKLLGRRGSKRPSPSTVTPRFGGKGLWSIPP